MFRLCTVLLACLFACSNALAASASTYILNTPDGTDRDFVFSLNVPTDSNDLYFHMSGPTAKSWISVGTTALMQGSQMFVVYTSANGTGVTLSSRLATGHVEPSYTTDIKATLLPGSGIVNGSYVANVHCQDCSTWAGGSLDLKSKAQMWSYAFGPSEYMQTDDQTATIWEHDEFGTFSLDMAQATGDGGVPTTFSVNSGSVTVQATKSDPNAPAIAHALIACIAFVIVMPSGVVALRVFDKIRWHWIIQLVGFVLAIVGVGLGLYLSKNYNFTSHYSTSHQILGIVVALMMIAQVALGWYNHFHFKKFKTGTYFGIIHRYFGYPVILIGAINGILGLILTNSNKWVLPYAIIAAVILVATVALVGFKRYQKRSNGGKGDNNEYGIEWISRPIRSDAPGKSVEPFRNV